MGLGFNFENAEGAENRTKKLVKVALAVEALQTSDTALDLRLDALELKDNIDYSLTEQDTGTKDVDGKSIYRKTF